MRDVCRRMLLQQQPDGARAQSHSLHACSSVISALVLRRSFGLRQGPCTGRWRRGWDSNPRGPCGPSGFQDRCNQPLCHLSVAIDSTAWLHSIRLLIRFRRAMRAASCHSLRTALRDRILGRRRRLRDRPRLVEADSAVWTEADPGSGAPAEGQWHRDRLREVRPALWTLRDSLQCQDRSAEHHEPDERQCKRRNARGQVLRKAPADRNRQPAGDRHGKTPSDTALDVVTDRSAHAARCYSGPRPPDRVEFHTFSGWRRAQAPAPSYSHS